MTSRQSRIVFLALLLPVTLAFHSYSHIWKVSTGHSDFMNHVLSDLCYIPIILAAIWFGLRGAVVSTTIVAIFFFLVVRLDPPGTPAELTSDYFEIMFLYLIGGTSGIVLDRDRRLRKILEDTQRHAASYNRSLIEASLDPLVTIGPDGKITDVNSATEAATGLSRDKLIGTDFADYFTEPASARLGYQQVFREGSVRDYPLEIRHRDGHITPVLYNASIYRNVAGEITGVFAAARDITERKQAEKERLLSEERFRALFDNMTNSVALWEIIEDTNGRPYDARFIEVNPAFEKLTGFGREQIIGNTISNIFPEFGQDWFDTVGQVARGGKPVRMIQTIKRLGKTFITSIYSPVPGKCAVIREDITDRIKAEEEVRKLNEELEQRVKDRTAQLEASNKELEAFSYSVSHDLRAPLRSIDGFSRIILEDCFDKLDDEGKRLFNVIRKNTQDMGKLIDGLLSLSRIGRLKLTRTQVDMKILADEVIDELKSAFPERIIEFNIKSSPCVLCDKVLMRQVLVNLISNAVKFTKARKVSTIEFGGNADGDEITYYVSDNGAGFDMKYADKLFGAFQRLHKADEFEGTGVGLAIVQRVIHMHGGKIWAESKINEGTTFYFSLPR